MKVSNLTSPRSGRPVANQYEIHDYDNEAAEDVYVFQSYETPIAKKQGVVYTVSADWCYSVTTSKYFAQWLRGYGWYDREIAELKSWLKKANDGDYFIPSNMNVTVKYVEEL